MRDQSHYTARLRQIAEDRYDALTKGKTTREMMEMDEILEEQTFLPYLEAKIARGLTEARAMIDILFELEVSGAQDVGDKYNLIWLKTYPGPEIGQMAQAKRSRTEMVARLNEIATDPIGDNVEEWLCWIDAWEADPPPTGYR